MKINYLLTHTYAQNKDTYDVKFKSNYRANYLCEIIAYVQFLTDKIEHASELSAIEIVTVLKMFYDNEIELFENDNVKYIIDEYENWEFYCPVASEIMGNKEFERPNLDLFIKKLLINQEELTSCSNK